MALDRWKCDAKGRGSARNGRAKKYKQKRGEDYLRAPGGWTPHRSEMLKSPAWSVLTHVARRILDRLEVENGAHAGTENGNLIVTYAQFQAYGIREASISEGIALLEALGFIRIDRGRRAAAGFNAASRYRLTYVPTIVGAEARYSTGPTDEWVNVETVERAREVRVGIRQAFRTKRAEEKSAPRLREVSLHTG